MHVRKALAVTSLLEMIHAQSYEFKSFIATCGGFQPKLQCHRQGFANPPWIVMKMYYRRYGLLASGWVTTLIEDTYEKVITGIAHSNSFYNMGRDSTIEPFEIISFNGTTNPPVSIGDWDY